MISRSRTLFVLIISALIAPAAWATVIYDVGTDWSNTSNPHGVWSYNQGTTPLTYRQANWGGVTGESFWTTTPTGTVPPAWTRAVINFGSFPGWQIGDVIGHSTNMGGGANANITWTSPAAGYIDISGAAWNAYHAAGRDDLWRLWVDGAVVAQRGSIISVARGSTDALFTNNLVPGGSLDHVLVAAGDTVVFQIQTLSSNGHFVGMDLTIGFDEIPEPGSLMLFGIGIALVAIRRCFRFA